MTRDVRESLTALAAVSVIFALIYLLPVILKGARLPWWLLEAGLMLPVAIVAGHIIRRRRTPR
jgi:hypothetical protein